MEAYLVLKVPRAVFCAQYGISVGTLSSWLKAYEAHGPKGLEPKRRGRKSGPGKALLPQPLRERVVTTKREHPSFGLRKVRDYVKRFFGMKVSAGGVASTLKREGVETPPLLRRRRRSKDLVRRFERALPGQLWQSDITSYRLARHSQRVYLVVFLDDHSRYVVSWGLSTRASATWVGEVLLEGIASFGKPEEVLTDQGPQYFAWRGKSGFQKLLLREGIRHVVARSHHPQTVGKCERLWQTIEREFWDRAKPQELRDARERIGHFFAHYNHFRPHQSLDGLLPADRFFGAQAPLRELLEQKLAEHELDLALGEQPRRSVYLMGQVGEHKVSLHARDGRIEVHTEQGLLERMALEEAGGCAPGAKHAPLIDLVPALEPLLPPTPDPSQAMEQDDEDDECDHERNDDAGADDLSDLDDLDDLDSGTGADAADAQAPLQEPPPSGDRGAGAPGGGERDGAAEGAGALRADPRAVAGQDEQGGDREAAVDPAAAGVAAQPAGAVGDDRGAPDPAANSEEAHPGERGAGEDRAARPQHGPRAAAEGDGTTAPGPGGGAAGERALEAVPRDARAALGDERCSTRSEERKEAGDAAPPARSGSESDSSYEPRDPKERPWWLAY